MSIRLSRRALVGAGLAAALVAGGSAVAVAATTEPAYTAPAAAADAQLSATLLALTEEERMAHDLYAAFAARYDQARPFSMIVNSESQHLATMRAMLTAYGVADAGAALPAGTYAVPAVQSLYDGWLAAGTASVKAAAQVGVDLEQRDIADLQVARAAATQSDLQAVLDRLIAASQHHLSAFQGTVDGTVTPGEGMGDGRGPGMGTGHGAGMGNGPGNGTATPGQRMGRGPGCGVGANVTPGAGTPEDCPMVG